MVKQVGNSTCTSSETVVVIRTKKILEVQFLGRETGRGERGKYNQIREMMS